MKKLLQKHSSNVVKKPRMELTIRTPYKTYLKSFAGFQNLLTKTTTSVLLVQNRMPPALHLLPPGRIQVKTLEKVEGFEGTLMHTGGWLVINSDNTCEINLSEAFLPKDVDASKINKADIDAMFSENNYVTKIRNSTQKDFLKKLA